MRLERIYQYQLPAYYLKGVTYTQLCTSSSSCPERALSHPVLQTKDHSIRHRVVGIYTVVKEITRPFLDDGEGKKVGGWRKVLTGSLTASLHLPIAGSSKVIPFHSCPPRLLSTSSRFSVYFHISL